MNSPEDEIPLPSEGVLSDEETTKQLREDMCRQYIDGMKQLRFQLIRSRSDNAKLRKALVGLVGADGDELDGMEALIRISPHAPDEDRAVTINAIHVLRETK